MDIVEKIYKSGLNLLKHLSLEETYEVIAKEAIKLVKGDEILIFISEESRPRLVYTTTPLVYRFKPRKRGFTYKTFKFGEIQNLNRKQLTKIHPEFKETKIKSCVLLPLSNQGKTVGVLTVMSEKDSHFKRGEVNALMLFSPMASLAMRKSMLYAEVKHALDTRDKFISMASHELRTPLTSVNGYAQLLFNKFKDQDTQEARWSEGLASESLRMTLLVKELLEINRIRSGQLHYYFKENSLREIADRAIKSFNFTQPHRKLVSFDDLKGDKDIIVGDFDKLLQVISNLLENAAKFSPSDQDITLKLKSNPKYLIVEVADKGIGIDKHDLPLIFDSYYRGSNVQKEGMGLGLFLVKNIIERHNGFIKMKSKVNKGTSVEIRLPKGR